MGASPRYCAASILLPLALACGRTERPAPGVSPGPNPGVELRAAGEVLATLERTACYGFCPVYKVTVYGDGRVKYEGRDYVKLTGPHTGTIGPEDIAALDAAFEEAKYFDLLDRYEAYEVTDNPSAFTSFTRGGRTKTVRHYHGDRSAPKVLTDLENRFDQIVRIEQWIGTEEERRERALREPR